MLLVMILIMLGPVFLGLACAMWFSITYKQSHYIMCVAGLSLTGFVIAYLNLTPFGYHGVPNFSILILDSFLFFTAIIAAFKSFYKKELRSDLTFGIVFAFVILSMLGVGLALE